MRVTALILGSLLAGCVTTQYNVTFTSAQAARNIQAMDESNASVNPGGCAYIRDGALFLEANSAAQTIENENAIVKRSLDDATTLEATIEILQNPIVHQRLGEHGFLLDTSDRVPSVTRLQEKVRKLRASATNIPPADYELLLQKEVQAYITSFFIPLPHPFTEKSQCSAKAIGRWELFPLSTMLDEERSFFLSADTPYLAIYLRGNEYLVRQYVKGKEIGAFVGRFDRKITTHR